jgi:hypothetical protein
MKKSVFASLVAGAIMIPGFAMHGDAIPIAGIETASESGLGDFTGTFVYTPGAGGTTGIIDLTLTNTSPAANGGFLTAFAFNNPNDLITGVTLSVAPASMDSLLGGPTFQNTINAQPYGDFDIGVANDSNNPSWQGGGNPDDGIPVGSTFTFQFSLTGTGLDALTEASFQAERSDDYNGSHGDFAPLVDGIQGPWNVARFRGFEDGGSDKVPGAGLGEPVPTAVPEPHTILLMAVGLGILSFFTRRRPTLN